MSAVAMELPLDWEPADACGADPVGSDQGGRAILEAGPASADPGGEPTLDSLLSGMWEGLAAHRSVACPVCDGDLVPVYGAHARPIGGRCGSCDTRLA